MLAPTLQPKNQFSGNITISAKWSIQCQQQYIEKSDALKILQLSKQKCNILIQTTWVWSPAWFVVGPWACQARGVVGQDSGGRYPPLFSTGGMHPHFLHFFGLKFVQKLVHCCNWLLTETQCKTVSVQHVCRPKLFKNLCLSLVSGIPPHFFFSGLHPCAKPI